MPKRKTHESNLALKKITTRAKAIVKSKPGTKWMNAIKQAGSDYRAGRLGSVGKLKKQRVAGIKKNADRKDNKRVNITVGAVGTVSGHMGAAKKMLAEQIGWAEACKFQAKTKTDKKKIGKKIAELKTKYRKLS